MGKVIFVSPKETIEISYPDWLSYFMEIVSKYLKVKTIKIKNGSKIKFMCCDECGNFNQPLTKKEREVKAKKKFKKLRVKCVYCKTKIYWGLTCGDCGYAEDKALQKVD